MYLDRVQPWLQGRTLYAQHPDALSEKPPEDQHCRLQRFWLGCQGTVACISFKTLLVTDQMVCSTCYHCQERRPKKSMGMTYASSSDVGGDMFRGQQRANAMDSDWQARSEDVEEESEAAKRTTRTPEIPPS